MIAIPGITLYVEGQSTTWKLTLTVWVWGQLPRVKWSVTYPSRCTFSLENPISSSLYVWRSEYFNMSLSKASQKMMSAELLWSTKTLFTLAFTIMSEITIESLCPKIIPSRLKLEKMISGVDDGLWIFFILSNDRLRTSWKCSLWVDLVLLPLANPPTMTLIILITATICF